MIYIDVLILVVIIVLCYLIKDFNRILNISSIITIVIGYIILLLSNICEIFIKSHLSYINTKHISLIVKTSFINRGLILILIGEIELIIYITIKLKRRIIKQ